MVLLGLHINKGDNDTKNDKDCNMCCLQNWIFEVIKELWMLLNLHTIHLKHIVVKYKESIFNRLFMSSYLLRYNTQKSWLWMIDVIDCFNASLSYLFCTNLCFVYRVSQIKLSFTSKVNYSAFKWSFSTSNNSFWILMISTF